MGRTGNIEEVRSENRRPSILSILIITIVLVAGAVSSVMFAYNLTKQSNQKAEAQKVKDEIVEQVVADIEKTYEPKVENTEPEVTIKTKEEIKEENGEFTDEYKKYEELTDEEKENSEVIPRKTDVDFEELEDIKEKQEEEKENLKEENPDIVIEEKIPSKFDLRDKIEIPVRNQGGFGLCWDFTMVKSIETNLALRTGEYYDLSEMYPDYMLSDGYISTFRRLHDGGNAGEFESIEGMVLEEEFPYGEYDADLYKDSVKSLQPTIYVNEIVYFPNPKNKSDSEKKDFRDTVKRHIMNYGSVYCSVYSPDSTADYMNKNNMYSTGSEMPKGFHAMSVIGWDDNYSKDNFDCVEKPKKDGAYIVMNSWGYCDYEIIYISYEDSCVENEMAGVINPGKEKINNYASIKFEDKNLYEAVKKNTKYRVKKYDDQTLELFYNKNDLDDFIYMSVENVDIKSFAGIENFTNLSSLAINNCTVEDISQIAKLEKLKVLTLSNCNISDFSFIKNKTIEHLNISNNPVDNLEFVKNLDNLKYLIASYTKIGNDDIKYITQNTGLVNLVISNTEITDYSFLAKLDNLVHVDLSGNIIEKNIKLSKSINSIGANNCGLTNLDFIKDCKNLKVLSLKDNDIKSIKSLNEIDETADHIVLAGNKNIEDLNELKIKTNYINLSNCNINSLDDLNNVKATQLILVDNNIEKIEGDYSAFDIFTINIANNPVKDIGGLATIENLAHIYAENCQISDVSNLKSKTNLYSLNLNGNKGVKGYNEVQLSSISLKGCDLDNNAEILTNKRAYTIDIKDNNITYINPDFLNDSNLRMLTLDNKIENINELYNIGTEKNIRLYCGDVTVDYNITLPSVEKLYLTNRDLGTYVRVVDTDNCTIEDGSIVVNTSNTSYIEFSYTIESYNGNLTTKVHANIDSYYPIEKSMLVTDKIVNKYVVDTGEKNYKDLNIKFIYKSSGMYELYGETTDYVIDTYAESNYDTDYGVADFYVDETFYQLSKFNSQSMMEFKETDSKRYYELLNSIGYKNIYSANISNKTFVGDTQRKSYREFVDVSYYEDVNIYKLLNGAREIFITSKDIVKMDISQFVDFDNLHKLVLINITPTDISDEFKNSGIELDINYHINEASNIAEYEDIYKWDGDKIYIPKLYTDLDMLYEESFGAILTIKDNKEKVNIYSNDYHPYEESISSYKIDESTGRVYFDGITFDDTKQYSIYSFAWKDNISVTFTY